MKLGKIQDLLVCSSFFLFHERTRLLKEVVCF
jgi:hypothetical protein